MNYFQDIYFYKKNNQIIFFDALNDNSSFNLHNNKI